MEEEHTKRMPHCSCQFVVTAGHDYSAYEADPDQLVGWEFVEEVRLHSSESPSCPICLHPPVAAQVSWAKFEYSKAHDLV